MSEIWWMIKRMDELSSDVSAAAVVCKHLGDSLTFLFFEDPGDDPVLLQKLALPLQWTKQLRHL